MSDQASIAEGGQIAEQSAPGVSGMSPAFPFEYSTGGHDGPEYRAVHAGMTLRDWFASQALVGSIGQFGALSAPYILAARAFEIADAMIAMREVQS